MWLKPRASPADAGSTYSYMAVYVCVDGNSDSKTNIRGVCNKKHLSNRWKHVSLFFSLFTFSPLPDHMCWLRVDVYVCVCVCLLAVVESTQKQLRQQTRQTAGNRILLHISLQ